jgi:hypothetical protein
VSFLARRLQAVPEPDAGRLRRLLTDLDARRFAVRQQALRELEGLGPRVRPTLERILANRPSLEVRRRVEDLLEAVTEKPLSPDELRAWRAVELLEQAGTPEALRQLQRLAAGATAARQTEAATGAVKRLAGR